MNILGLILCNVMWSLTHSANKVLLADYHPLEVVFFRQFFGLLSVLPILAFRFKMPKDFNRSDFRLVLIGLVTFFASPVFYINGLTQSRAIDSAVMVAFEPLQTIVLAVIFLKDKLRIHQLVSVVLAFFGAFILSDVSPQGVSVDGFDASRLIGNGFLLLSTGCEAMYSIIGKPIIHRRAPVVLISVALAVGASCLFGYIAYLEGPSRLAGLAPLVTNGTWKHWALALFLGAGCTGFTYLYWAALIPKISLTTMALTLYVQPVLGMLWGWLLVGERLSFSNLVGAAMILTAVALSVRSSAIKNKS